MMASGINLVMTVFGFAVSSLFIVFMCSRLVCARIQLNSSRRSFALASRSDLSMLERGFHGLEPVRVSKFPTKKYGDEFFSAAEDAQCTVCLAEYHTDDILRILPNCGHFFHATCIDIWLQQHPTCPVCRISLRDPDKKRMIMQPMFSSAIRYNHRIESFGTHSYHCLLSGHGIQSRSIDSRPMSRDHDDRFETNSEDQAESGENIDSSYGRTKECCVHSSGNKRIESPSNT